MLQNFDLVVCLLSETQRRTNAGMTNIVSALKRRVGPTAQ